MPVSQAISRVSALLAALSVAAAACTAPSGSGPPASPTSPSPEAAVPAVEVKVSKVRTFPLEGKVRSKRVRGLAEDVGDTMATLYSAGFVDPGAWEGGRFPGILRFFGRTARRDAREDRERLTLGPAANRLTGVFQPRVRLRVDVLTDQGRNPRAVLASVGFAGKGLTEDRVEVPVRHRARYLLRRSGGAWRIVAYRVKRRVAPVGIPGIPRRGTFFVLAIGSDARVGQSVAGARADSLHVIGINLREEKASILGIPRDSYVPIPGHGADKINAALFFGGPDLVVRTVEGLTGVRMDGYMLTGFAGFQGLVNGIGGVTVRVPYPMSDAASGAYFKPGEVKVNGKRALAFSRNRHDGPSGDLGRSLNQGGVLLAALREFRDDMARDPLTLFRWIQVAGEHVQTDLEIDEMLALLYAALSIEPSRVRNRVASGGGGTVGGASVVRLGSSARAMFRDLRRDGVLGG